MKKVVLAYSGGLDTSFCVMYLTKELGYEVYTALANTGGFSAEELKAVGNDLTAAIDKLYTIMVRSLAKDAEGV